MIEQHIMRLERIYHMYDGEKVLDIPELSIKKGAVYCLVGAEWIREDDAFVHHEPSFRANRGRNFFSW